MFVQIVDAWTAELMTSVDELAGSVVHKYASWSVERLAGAVDERHILVCPAGEAEVASGQTTDPSDLGTQTYLVAVWEDASTETTRLKDEEPADQEWLELSEAIIDRFYRAENLRLGSDTIQRTRYNGVTFDRASGKRVMLISFLVQVTRPYI